MRFVYFGCGLLALWGVTGALLAAVMQKSYGSLAVCVLIAACVTTVMQAVVKK